MNDIAALHTAARRYLIDRHVRWTTRYAELGSPTSGKYSDHALDTFSRYNVLAAILADVERRVPEDWATPDAARADLMAVARTAESPFTCDPISAIDARAMAEERELFVEYLQGLSPVDLAKVEPLPFRRVLNDGEAEELHNRLSKNWGIEGYWYPLDGVERPHVVAFQAPHFRRNVTAERLRSLIAETGVTRVYEMREYGPEYEIDLSELDPHYNGAEGYWFAERLDWIIYASHESSITVGGKWFVSAVKTTWPDWERFVWTSPFF